MHRRHSLITFLAIAMLTACTHKAPASFPELDSYFDALVAKDRLMFSVHIAQGDTTLYQRSTGWASVEDRKVIDQNSTFRIGSITKTFTAVMILQLVEAKQLSLDTPLATFYPEIANADEITIEHMLKHTSGIFSFTNDEGYPDFETEGMARDELVALITSYPPQFDPGSQHEYSNSNYVLLGYIIETLLDTTYAAALQERIASPLKLDRTRYGHAIDVDNGDAHSYQYQFGKWIRASETDMGIPHGAGAIVSTPAEVNAFMQALFKGALISPESVTAMQSLQDGYGLGIGIMPFYDKRFFGHNGGIDGFVSSTGFNPKDGIVFTLLSNGVNVNFNDILIAMLSAVYGKDGVIPDYTAKPVTLEKEQLQRTLGTFESEALPMDIRFFLQGDELMSQATGQGAFPLTPYSEVEYRFDPAGIIIVFDPDSENRDGFDKFTLNQGGGKFLFTRKP